MIAATHPTIAGRGRNVYAGAILLSSFLLFLVQPMLAKAMLPWFGGVAGVWAVAMLFFQGVLLLGYAYAYFTVTYLAPRAQAAAHLALVAGSALVLPLAPARPGAAADPAAQILMLLLATVGLPYFLLSTTGPLLQAWYSRSHRVDFPYRLFALSNAGSLLALLAYPVTVEPFLATRLQMLAWSWGYAAFIVLCGASAVLYWRSGARVGAAAPSPAEHPSGKGGRKPAPKPARAVDPVEAASRPPVPGWRDYLLWVALAACASALMLAVTGHLSQNIAPMPLLWILPLSTYLLTFILCFDRSRWYRPESWRWLIWPALAGMGCGFFRPDLVNELSLALTLYLAGLFVCCMFCHGELAHRKPPAKYLTNFYLALAFGGAGGSMSVALAAPRFTSWPLEFPAALVICGLLASSLLWRAGWSRRVLQVALVAAFLLLTSGDIYARVRHVTMMARSFYGAVSVSQVYAIPGDESSILRQMYHGWIRHGAQFVAPERRLWPTTYYGPRSGAGLVLARPEEGPRRVGLIGLGVGTLAAYGRPGDTFQFYEIDPLVAHLAVSQFTYLESCPARVDLAIGDGRLLLERDTGPLFDILVLDAFLGDSIPIHLLTREAFDLYFRRVKPSGMLAVHISNRYVDLLPLLEKTAADRGVHGLYILSGADAPKRIDPAHWVLLSRNAEAIRPFSPYGKSLPPPPPGFAMWTDEYSNILRLLR